MTDLTKGIFEIGGMTVTSNTTKEDIYAALGDGISLKSTDRMLRLKSPMYIDGQQFMCYFYFDKGETITLVKMYPLIEYKSAEGDRMGGQAERRQVCDKWLYERIGNPHKDVSGSSEYIFGNIKIASVSSFDIRDGGSAGYIAIIY